MRLLLPALVALLSFVAPLHPQVGREMPGRGDEGYYVEGYLLDAEGKAIGGARVVLSPFGTEMGQTLFSDSDGLFSFQALKRGSYKLSVSAVGFEPYTEPVSLLGGSQNLRITLKSQTSGGKVPSPKAGQVVSTADLGVPQKAREHYQKGVQFLEQKKYEDGIAEFKAALKEHPAYAAAHSTMGITLLQIKKTKEADEAFKKAIEINPSSYEGHVGLGLLLNDQKKWAEAEKHLLQARQVSAEGWQVHYELGRALNGQARFPEAEASLQTARQKGPDYPNLYLLLANVYVLQGKYEPALSEMKYFLEKWPEDKLAGQVRDKVKLLEAEVESQKKSAQGKGQ